MMTGFPLTMASWGTMLGIARMGAARACANFGFTGALCGSLPSARIASSSSFCKHKHPHLIFMTACLYNEAQYSAPTQCGSFRCLQSLVHGGMSSPQQRLCRNCSCLKE